ncbi:MAG: 30S ribosomal protein S20 [Patescibacteria group bacterium]|nr:30S ribosomal protein S20 [Patescibacteria group bacterium]
MPKIKSAKKQLRQNRKRAARNTNVKSAMKGAVKDFVRELSGDSKKAKDGFSKLQKLIDTSAKKKVISKKKAGRMISRLQTKLNPKAKSA